MVWSFFLFIFVFVRKTKNHKVKKGMTIFFDNNSTTVPYPRVVSVVRKCMTSFYANPFTPYAAGKRVGRVVEESRARIKRMLGVRPDEAVLFTSCATESNNIVIRGRVAAFRKPPHIITTNTEHSSVFQTCRQLAEEGRCTLSIVPTDRCGLVGLDVLGEEVRRHGKRLAMVCVILANNETGVVQDAGALRKACGRHFLHVDATQCVGKMPVAFSKLGVDSASFGAHKFHGPRIGGLYLRDPRTIRNACCTGGRSEEGLRSGTPNTAYILGMEEALAIGLRGLEKKIRHTSALRDYLQSSLLAVPGTKINAAGAPRRLCNTLSVVLPIRGRSQQLVRFLDKHGICVGVGSACNRSSRSRALAALGLTPLEQKSTLRISLTHANTRKECDAFLSVLRAFLKRAGS